MNELNVYNILKCPKYEDPIAFIFKKTNDNIKNIILNNKYASIIRIGGSDYTTFIGKFNPIIYELNGYFDKTNNKDNEKKNF